MTIKNEREAVRIARALKALQVGEWRIREEYDYYEGVELEVSDGAGGWVLKDMTGQAAYYPERLIECDHAVYQHDWDDPDDRCWELPHHTLPWGVSTTRGEAIDDLAAILAEQAHA